MPVASAQLATFLAIAAAAALAGLGGCARGGSGSSVDASSAPASPNSAAGTTAAGGSSAPSAGLDSAAAPATPAAATPAPSGEAAPSGPYRGLSPLADKYTFRGRWDFTTPLQPNFEWENAAVGLTFSASDTVTAELFNLENRLQTNTLQVTVDGMDGNKITFQPGVTRYTLATGLGAGQHTLWLSKAQEYGFGAIGLGAIELAEGGKLAAPPALPSRRLLFLGSSTLSGWGADGSDATTPDACADEVNFPMTNGEHSIPRYTADFLQADFHNLSRGAAGIMVTFAEGVKLLPQTYGLTIDKPPIPWDASRWRADAVIVEAGGSDLISGDGGTPDQGLAPLTPGGQQVRGYTSNSAPSMQTFPWADFAAAYLAFVKQLRADHPGALIVLVKTHNQTGISAPALEALLNTIAASFADGRVVRYDFFSTPTPKYPNGPPYTDYYQMAAVLGSGCQNHSSPAGSRYMAERLSEFLGGKLGW